MLEIPFRLYAALLLSEGVQTGYSRFIPHQWKGCYGSVCAVCGHAAVRGGGRSLPRRSVEGVARHRKDRRGMHHAASLQTNTPR